MSLLPEVYTELIVDSDVAAIVGEEIYRHGEAPEAPAGSYITWFLVTGVPENTLADPPPIDRMVVQIDCWGNNQGTGDEEVEELALAVRSALEPFHHCEGVVVNGRDPETKRYRIGMTFTWWLHRA